MISIISPVYNMEKYLEDCIKSILSQDYADFEVLFVNDGSSDSTLEILRKYEQQDSRIRVFDKINEGQGVARNYALQFAKGDYVLYLDPDDWLEEGALRKIYNKFQEDNYDVIFFNAYRYYQETGVKNPYRFIDCFYTRFKNHVFNSENAADILFETNGLCFKAYNKDFLVNNNIKYTATKYIEDSEFFIRVVLAAKKMVCMDEFIYNYRIHKTSSSSTTHQNIDIFEKTFYICEKIFIEYYTKETNQVLLSSFLKNRITQLFYHYNKVNNDNKKEFYNMMRRIFVHIKKTYGLQYVCDTTLKFRMKNVLKYNYEFYRFNKKLISLKCAINCYLDI